MSTEIETCSICGRLVAAGSRFCPNCGHAMQQPSSARVSGGGEVTMPAQGAPTVNVGYAANPMNWQPGQYATAPQPGTQTLQPMQPAYSGAHAQSSGYRPVTAPAQTFTGWGRDPLIAFLLELLGYVGFLGIGHIYAGRVTRGVSLLVAWFMYGFIAAFFAFSVFGLPVACFMAIAWPALPIVSGFWIKRDLDGERAFYTRR